MAKKLAILRHCQNHRLRLRGSRPASSAIPMVATMAKPPIPKNELGKPKTLACQVRITEPQLKIGLKLQLGM